MDPASLGTWRKQYHILSLDQCKKTFVPYYPFEPDNPYYGRLSFGYQPGENTESADIIVYYGEDILQADIAASGNFSKKSNLVAEVAKPLPCTPCPPDNITGISPIVIPDVADAIVDAANNAVGSSGLARLIEPGMAFYEDANVFYGAWAGTPITVYSNTGNYCQPCNAGKTILYHIVPYYSSNNELIGNVQLNPSLVADIFTIGIPDNSLASAKKDLLKFEEVKQMFPNADDIYPVWAENEITGIPSTYFWKIIYSNGEETYLTAFGEEMVASPLTNVLYRKDIDLSKPSKSIITLPSKYNIYQNYPNPFNGTTNINFDLAEPAHVMLEIYNIRGQKVKTLVNQWLDSGHKTVTWDGTNTNGDKVSSGIYFYKFQIGNHIESRKLHFLK